MSPIELESVAKAVADILEPRFERLDSRLDKVMTVLDGISKTLETREQEDVVRNEQLRRHSKQLEDHEDRLTALGN